jgi:hypothetical protein
VTNEKLRERVDGLVKKRAEDYRKYHRNESEESITAHAEAWRDKYTEAVLRAEKAKKKNAMIGRSFLLSLLCLFLYCGYAFFRAKSPAEASASGPNSGVTKAVPTAYEIQTGDYSAMAQGNCNTAWNRLASDGRGGQFDEDKFKKTCNRRMESVLTACAKKAAVPEDVIRCASPQYATVMEASLANSL